MPITNYNEITEGQYDVLKEIGNMILNGTIDPETELEVNGVSLTIAEIDELLPFLEKKYGGA